MASVSKRDEIVGKADALFYENGFEATSFADIATALGISRGNFYYHFKTKDEILQAVIDKRLSDTSDMLADWAADYPTPRDRILAFVNILIANRTGIMTHGCPVGTLSTELAKLDHAAKGRAAEVFTLFTDWLEGEFRALGMAEHSHVLALHLQGRVQGVAVMVTAFPDEALLRREVAEIETWLDATCAPAAHH